MKKRATKEEAQQDREQVKKYGPRTLCMNGLVSLSEIWREAERKLGIDRPHFALVHQSHYLAEEGTATEPIHLLEVRYRGGEAGENPELAAKLSGEFIFRMYQGNGDIRDDLRE
jgi:hypothetical protein